MGMSTICHSRHFTVEDQTASPWHEIPFDVPPGQHTVHVRLDVDRNLGVVDLGCLGADEAGQPTVWRGWSGGARDEFGIGTAEATPGYLPGPVTAGTWAVVIGLHRLPAHGLDIRLRITTGASLDLEAEPDAAPGPEVPRGSDRQLPAPRRMRWIAGDFHSHTVHSDGALGIGELAARGRAAGLDVLAVTDHNTVSHHRLLPELGKRHGIQLLPGQEVTTSRGHANVFGDVGWIDFREPASHWFTEATQRGAVASVNHPLADDCAWQHPVDELPTCVEFLHRTWMADRTWTGPWTLLNLWRPGVTLLGGSDFHADARGHAVGEIVTWVLVPQETPPSGPELTKAVLDALRDGRTAVSADGVRGPALLRVDGEVLAVGADGAVLVDRLGVSRVVHGDVVKVAGGEVAGPLRLQTARGAILAATQ